MNTATKRAVLMLSALALTASACADGPREADGLTTIRITVSNATEPYVIPWLVGNAEGIFASYGVNVERIIAGKGGSSTLRNLVSGDLAIGEVSLPAIVDASHSDTPVTAVGGATRSVYGLDFYSMADRSFADPADAKKWAYTTPRSVTESLTYLLPQRAGIDPASIERVHSGGIGEGIALLESGAVDVSYVPSSVVAQQSDRFRKVVDSRMYLPDFQQSVITVNNSYLDEHPDVVRGVLAGYQESVDWIAANPDQAAGLYAADIAVDKEQARRIVDGAIAADDWSVGLDKNALESAAEALREADPDLDIPWCTIFDLDYLPAGAARELPVECGSK
ncbi:hypothetical protein CH274_10695 [Rhodococcus sp. 06-418-5]|uniref:ABC transporter substrate-binding protein n=1 Tax=Rhodococcus sp. 06-418-5 TaxID=2022507 RepID=UPI000B9B9869|nr:ABC transporter substrate-binding protein [Rhodococcus sp. 06-418-5]OZC81546.1 hypothetical protein CH274_10695 [Rhodococcus sp. 06-418-5]